MRIDPLQRRESLEGARSSQARVATGAFAGIFGEALENSASVRFSSHAMRRIAERDIVLDGAQRRQLDDAFAQLSEKGSRKALVVMDEAALLVSVPNRTVITLMNRSEMADTVFTNIDSAVLVPPPGTSPQPSSLPLM